MKAREDANVTSQLVGGRRMILIVRIPLARLVDAIKSSRRVWTSVLRCGVHPLIACF